MSLGDKMCPGGGYSSHLSVDLSQSDKEDESNSITSSCCSNGYSASDDSSHSDCEQNKRQNRKKSRSRSVDVESFTPTSDDTEHEDAFDTEKTVPIVTLCTHKTDDYQPGVYQRSPLACFSSRAENTKEVSCDHECDTSSKSVLVMEDSNHENVELQRKIKEMERCLQQTQKELAYVKTCREKEKETHREEIKKQESEKELLVATIKKQKSDLSEHQQTIKSLHKEKFTLANKNSAMEIEKQQLEKKISSLQKARRGFHIRCKSTVENMRPNPVPETSSELVVEHHMNTFARQHRRSLSGSHGLCAGNGVTLFRKRSFSTLS